MSRSRKVTTRYGAGAGLMKNGTGAHCLSRDLEVRIMVIKVTGKAAGQKYRITCTDKSCRNIIEFEQDDITKVTRSCMGRDAGSVQGISCPDCRQVLPAQDATLI